MKDSDIKTIAKNWNKISVSSECLASNIFDALSKIDPVWVNNFKSAIHESDETNEIFIGLVDFIDRAVSLIENDAEFSLELNEMSRRNESFGLINSSCGVVKTALLQTLESMLGSKFDDDAYLAWSEFYDRMALCMAGQAPPSVEVEEATTVDNTEIVGVNVEKQPTHTDAIKEEYINLPEGKEMTKDKSDSNLNLFGAINNTLTAIMMIDRDFKVTFANKATMDLFSKHESTFRSIWPSFRATEEFIMGYCIDNFHKDPAHQRKLLSDQSRLPYRTDIKIAHLIIELNVTGIVDAEGNYVGNTLEWNDVTEVRYQADRAVRLQGAIDQSGTPIMMVDRDLIITYANEATLDLLQKHESVFRQKWPSFKSDSKFVIGACIDTFHKDPAHQRKLLSNPDNLPWRTDIAIMDLKFELKVTAIYDSSNAYIGNSLEWQDVTEIRAQALLAGRLSSAVEGMTTNLMMADVNGNIVYANPSVIAMLRRRESDLRSVLPSFSVNKIIGSNYDSFHKNPSHQQNLLGNPDNLPYQADISVAGLEFNLTAIALRDSAGKHVGTAVQWVDTTEQNDAQRQIEGLIKAAIDGDLERRIDSSSYQGFMKVLGNGINSLMDAIVEPVNATIDIIQSLSGGDVSRNMDGEYGGQFLALSNAINESMSNLRNMVTEIRSASSSVFSAAREIAEGNNDLSQRTETQASNLEETASAMEELTTTVQQNAQNASEVTKLAGGAMDKASNGGVVVKSAVEAMENINRSSKKIADIIGVIDEIAFQTNLLALNAAVEAARAGEQGRGFAVVAAEVRNLAQRSAAAAKEIKGLINDSVEAVGKGTRLVDETGQTFADLINSFKEVVSMISDIDSASNEQAAGIGEISQAVAQMDEMTQQNAALVEEASASSRSMEDQAQALLDQVSFFHTGEESAQPVLKSPKPKATARVGKPIAGRSEAPKARPAPAKTKRKSDDEWEEF